ncbi:hypothetical protein EVAR_79239_1 [Eumeta japonica]|uniref:Uncharacterized protein n=1 Tax=Eumeta variegata TaxID=151549 RepID=A0A4C1ZBY4_EUMVA|nr:hypothetical protein EVAR_79239_1 [Eumeta japonica]
MLSYPIKGVVAAWPTTVFSNPQYQMRSFAIEGMPIAGRERDLSREQSRDLHPAGTSDSYMPRGRRVSVRGQSVSPRLGTATFVPFSILRPMQLPDCLTKSWNRSAYSDGFEPPSAGVPSITQRRALPYDNLIVVRTVPVGMSLNMEVSVLADGLAIP